MEDISRRTMLGAVAAAVVAPQQLLAANKAIKRRVADVHYWIVSRKPDGTYDWEVCYRVDDEPWRIERRNTQGNIFRLTPARSAIVIHLDDSESGKVGFLEDRTHGQWDVIRRIGNVTTDYIFGE